jgi:DNA-binding response OmpR family regulator
MSISSPVVLVVEDRPLADVTLCKMLSVLDFHPFHARTADEAHGLLAMIRMDALVFDVPPPDGAASDQSGIALLAIVHAMPIYAHLPVVIFTGAMLSSAEHDLARECGADVFYKPQAYRNLIKQLEVRLGRQGTTARNRPGPDSASAMT